MRKETLLLGTLTLSAFILQGCLVTTKTYSLRKDRVDQSISSGNRGYLTGKAPADADSTPRKTTRVTQVVEMEFAAPKEKKAGKKTAAPVVPEQQYQEQGTEETPDYSQDSEEVIEEKPSVEYKNYTVGKNDTLQKISMKFYGTTKKWYKIFKANSDALKGPNKIYPGQVIKLPMEGMINTESGENLK